MNVQYRHSQPGYLFIVIGLTVLVVAAFMCAYGVRQPVIIVGAISIFLLVFGYKLTVEIKDGFLRFWFGPGVFWKKISLEQIAYCEPFKGVFAGWGIRFVWNGWLYNVSGLKAVTIILKSGKKMHIGTNEPVRLIEAINSALRPAGGDDASGVWAEIKTDYLGRVEQALSAARHPRSFEILADIGSHLDQRFAELPQQQRTWENFQKVITEMGPPAEYAELMGQQQATDKQILSAGYVIALVLILASVTAGMILLPKMLKQNKVAGVQWTFVNDAEVAGKWVSVDFVKEPNEFNPDKRRWQGDLFMKDIGFNPDGTMTLNLTWTKGWISDRNSNVKAEYEIRQIDGTTYLFMPWLSGDVTIRHQKPQYYVLRKVSETVSQKQVNNEQAIEATKSWLQLIDEDKYNESWEQAAEFFKKYVSRDQWKNSLDMVRKPLGKMISRRVINSTYTTTLPGAPDGRYVVIQFETSFENKQNAVETVTPMLDSDGRWRVSGYYIR